MTQQLIVNSVLQFIMWCIVFATLHFAYEEFFTGIERNGIFVLF